MSEWIPTHGKRATYLAGCRCDACKAAQAAYRQRPEVKAAQKAYNTAYFSRPDVKAARKARRQRPEVKAAQRASLKAYRKRLVALAKLAQAHGLTLPEEP